MADTKNSTVDFAVTFFVADRATTKLLSEVVKNREDKSFRESLGLPKDFVLPFSQEESDATVVYMVKQSPLGKFKSFLNEEACDEHIIQHGDYLTFKTDDGKAAFKLIIVATSNIKLGYKKYQLSRDTNIFIGRMPTNHVSFELSDHVSREKHAAIRIDGNGNAFVEDIKRSVGVYVNGRAVHSQKLDLFDEVFLMGLSIVYLGSSIAVRSLAFNSKDLSAATSFECKQPIEAQKEVKCFVRTPRILKSLDTDEFEIDAPPNPPTMDKTPALLAIGPSLTMSIVMLASLGVSVTSAMSGGGMSTVIASGVMAVGMLAGSLLWPMLLRSYQKRSVLAEDKYRKSRYSSYIAEIEKKLAAKTDRAVRLLNDSLSPTPDYLCALLDNESNRLRLWERSYEDADFLAVRLGLGQRAFGIKLKIPKQGFQLHEDELRSLPVKLSEKYGILNGVPATLDIRNNQTIGIIGNRTYIQDIISEILLNIVSLHSYDEVKLVIVTSPRQAKSFEMFKNIPHIWSNDKKVRYFATTPDEVHFVFNVIDDAVKTRENTADKTNKVVPIPHYVLIVTEPDLIEKEALLRYIDDADNNVGITTVFAYGDITQLPKSCKTIIQSDEYRTGYYIKNKNENRFIEFSLDKIDNVTLNRFVDKLAALIVKRDFRTLGVPDRISFLQMYKAGNVAELSIQQHWDNNNSAKSIAAPIGIMAGGEAFKLDIHEAYHGCHGLVAGTTGSGKSEFLQAFVLSLAINYSPKEVAFVLVDFKGGDMARPFMAKPFSPALPHLAATISNLSGNILYRALVSFEAEIKSRQRLFNEAAALLGVDKLDINSYHKYFKAGRLRTPLPHLIIIIDEFAQLKTQQPDFLAQLINVAQVGRSLGIHLILATQKPSGVVDPQIWSNSRFKVCLKVADKQDSIDMINKPDSAMIKNPGRCYVQVGYDEIYECVQSGYSGADYVPTKAYMPDEEITVQMTDNTANPIHSAKLDFSGNKSDKTQLEAVVADLVALGKKKNCFVKPLWLDVLSERVLLNLLAKGTKSLCAATIGLVDYVRTQEQKPLTIDFTKSGHIAFYGASGTGKTTFLQTLVYSLVCDYAYAPDELSIYAMDFGGRSLGYLETLPHSGGVVFADEEAKIADLSEILHNIIDERKRLFVSNNCGTFVDYRAVSKQVIPAILVLIDNFSTFRNKYMDLSESFFDIIASGKTFGVYFVITGSTRNSIYYKVTEHISTYFTLKMNDTGNYFDIHNVRPPIMPADIDGRGITVINKEVVEFQVALAVDGENEAERVSAICDKYAEIANAWTGSLPIKISEKDEHSEPTDTGRYEYSTRVTYSPSVRNNPPESIPDEIGNLILGSSKTGALLYGLILSEDFKLSVCADNMSVLSACYTNILKNISEYSNRKIFFLDDESGSYESLLDECPTCNYIKGGVELESLLEDLKPELNARLEDEEKCLQKMFIIIPDYNNFFGMITDEQAVFMRKVLQHIDSPKYGICFICGFDVNKDKSNDRLFVSLVVNAENYVICPNSYGKAAEKIESLPFISDAKSANCYLCKRDKNTAIRW